MARPHPFACRTRSMATASTRRARAKYSAAGRQIAWPARSKAAIATAVVVREGVRRVAACGTGPQTAGRAHLRGSGPLGATGVSRSSFARSSYESSLRGGAASLSTNCKSGARSRASWSAPISRVGSVSMSRSSVTKNSRRGRSACISRVASAKGVLERTRRSSCNRVAGLRQIGDADGCGVLPRLWRAGSSAFVCRRGLERKADQASAPRRSLDHRRPSTVVYSS
jgi:hypothetical protein